MTISDSKQKSLIIMAILTGLWILFCALFFGIERLLPEGYSYRSLFRLATVGFLILSGIILTLLWLIRISGAIWARTKIPAFFRVIFCLLFIGLWIVFCLFSGIVALFYGLDTDTEVKEKNGMIYMRRDNFLGPPDFYYEKAVNPLLRRSLSATEERNHPVPSPQPERKESHLTSEEPSPTPSEPTNFPNSSSPQEQTDSSDSSSTQEKTDSSGSSSPQEPTPSEQPSGKDDPLYPEFMAVHNFLDEKKRTFRRIPDSVALLLRQGNPLHDFRTRFRNGQRQPKTPGLRPPFRKRKMRPIRLLSVRRRFLRFHPGILRRQQTDPRRHPRRKNRLERLRLQRISESHR